MRTRKRKYIDAVKGLHRQPIDEGHDLLINDTTHHVHLIVKKEKMKTIFATMIAVSAGIVEIGSESTKVRLEGSASIRADDDAMKAIKIINTINDEHATILKVMMKKKVGVG